MDVYFSEVLYECYTAKFYSAMLFLLISTQHANSAVGTIKEVQLSQYMRNSLFVNNS